MVVKDEAEILKNNSKVRCEQYEEQIHTLNEEKEHMEDELTRLIAIVQDRETSQSNEYKVRIELESKVEELRSELKIARNKISEQEKSRIHTQSTQLSQINDLNKQRMKYESEIEKLEEKCIDLNNKNETFQNEIEEQNDLISSLKYQNETLKSKNAGDTNNAMKAYEQKVTNLSRELESRDQKHLKLIEK